MAILTPLLGLRAATLGYRIAAAVPWSSLYLLLFRLDLCGKLRILRTTHIPAALNGAEASLGFYWLVLRWLECLPLDGLLCLAGLRLANLGACS